MSDSIYKQIESSFTKQPILYQFRKFIAKEITVPVFSREFVTGNLFPDSEIPCKLHFVLVETNAKCGDQTKNPFNFPRKFFIKPKENEKSSNLAVQIDQTCMYEKLRDMHKANRTLQQQLVDALSKINQTLGKISQTSAQSEPEQSTSSGITTRANPQHRVKGTKRIRINGTDEDLDSNQSFQSCNPEDLEDEENLQNASYNMRHQQRQEMLNASEFPVFIETFELDMNSAPISQV